MNLDATGGVEVRADLDRETVARRRRRFGLLGGALSFGALATAHVVVVGTFLMPVGRLGVERCLDGSESARCSKIRAMNSPLQTFEQYAACRAPVLLHESNATLFLIEPGWLARDGECFGFAPSVQSCDPIGGLGADEAVACALLPWLQQEYPFALARPGAVLEATHGPLPAPTWTRWVGLLLVLLTGIQVFGAALSLRRWGGDRVTTLVVSNNLVRIGDRTLSLEEVESVALDGERLRLMSGLHGESEWAVDDPEGLCQLVESLRVRARHRVRGSVDSRLSGLRDAALRSEG